MATTSYSIAGEILDTDYAELEKALESPSWRLRRGNDDAIQLRGDELDMEIYASGRGKRRGWDFLVSARMDGEASEVRAALEHVGQLLAARDIVYSLAFMEEGGSDEEIISHPEYGQPAAQQQQQQQQQQQGSIVFRAGAEWAPDSPWGLDIVEIDAGGAVRYENRVQGEVTTGSARAEPGVWDQIMASLDQASFPAVPAHQIPPGASLVELVVRGPEGEERVHLSYHAALKFAGYSDVIRRFDQWATWLRGGGKQGSGAPAGLIAGSYAAG